jgi:hypothetical protein
MRGLAHFFDLCVNLLATAPHRDREMAGHSANDL